MVGHEIMSKKRQLQGLVFALPMSSPEFLIINTSSAKHFVIYLNCGHRVRAAIGVTTALYPSDHGSR